MNTNGRSRDDAPNVATSFAGLTHDVIELAELQAQLLALDVKNTSQKARTSVVLVVVGVCVLLGTIPVALLTIAALLVQQFGWSQAAGYGVATLIGLLTSAGVLGRRVVAVPNGHRHDAALARRIQSEYRLGKVKFAGPSTGQSR